MPGPLPGINAFALLHGRPREQRGETAERRRRNEHCPQMTDERRPTRQERIPLGIVYMLIATVMFAGTSALAKWLVAIYPIGEVLFVRTATALIGSSLVILPVTGLAVFRTRRLRDHLVRGVSQSCAQ